MSAGLRQRTLGAFWGVSFLWLRVSLRFFGLAAKGNAIDTIAMKAAIALIFLYIERLPLSKPVPEERTPLSGCKFAINVRARGNGKQYAYCDFLAACLGTKKKAQERLVQIT